MTDDEHEKLSHERAAKSALAALATGAELALPGAGLLTRLVEHVSEALEDSQRRKLHAFHVRLLHGLESDDEREERFRKCAKLPEFSELVASMLRDFDAEKADVYGVAAVQLAEGMIPPEFSRDVVHAVRELRFEDLRFLAEVAENERTHEVHENRKIQSARHPGIARRLLIVGCLEDRLGDVVVTTDFGKLVLQLLNRALV